MSRVAGAGATGTQDARGASRGGRKKGRKMGAGQEKIPPLEYKKGAGARKKGGPQEKKTGRDAGYASREKHPFGKAWRKSAKPFERSASERHLATAKTVYYLPSLFVNTR